MFNMPAILMGAAGSAFLAASFAPGMLHDASSRQAPAALQTAASAAPSFDDQVLFRPDPLMDLQYFVRSPRQSTAGRERRAPAAVPAPERREESRDTPKKSHRTLGCIASVSPLTQAYAEQKSPSLCLAGLEQSQTRG